MSTATRKCCGCKERYVQALPTWFRTPSNVWFHDRVCASIYAINRQKAANEKAAKKERREKKIKVLGLPHANKLTQPIINAYVLLRDRNRPCISCGIQNHEISSKGLTGSEWHAGHFLSVGSHPEIRYHLWNINKQCSICNHHLSSNRAGYEQGIIARYGQERLDWLKGRHEMPHITIEYLAKIRKVFAKKKRLLKKRMKRYE